MPQDEEEQANAVIFKGNKPPSRRASAGSLRPPVAPAATVVPPRNAAPAPVPRAGVFRSSGAPPAAISAQRQPSFRKQASFASSSNSESSAREAPDKDVLVERSTQHICAALNVRPLLPNEVSQGASSCLSLSSTAPEVQLGIERRVENFRFDYVYDNNCARSCEQLYAQCVAPLVDGLFLGYHGCVLAYGQTGAGKSYTMGSDTERCLQVVAAKAAAAASGHNAAVDFLNTKGSAALAATLRSTGALGRPGTGPDPIIHRTMEDCCRLLQQLGKEGVDAQMFVSFMEIYQDNIRDLLTGPATSQQQHAVGNGADGPSASTADGFLSYRDNGTDVSVVGLTEVPVTTPEEMLACLVKGIRSRTTAATSMNQHSSRSHAIFTVRVRQVKPCSAPEDVVAAASGVPNRPSAAAEGAAGSQEPPSAPTSARSSFDAGATSRSYCSALKSDASPASAEGTAQQQSSGPAAAHVAFTAAGGAHDAAAPQEPEAAAENAGLLHHMVVEAKLHLVDLAGSERLSRSHAEGQRLQEACSINQGLLALGNVIDALVNKPKGGHVPYRDHILTRVLRNALGGNSKTTMIACVSPSDLDLYETMNTLRYATRARTISVTPMVNCDAASAQIAALRKERDSLIEQLVLLQQQVNAYQAQETTRLSAAEEELSRLRGVIEVQNAELANRRHHAAELEHALAACIEDKQQLQQHLQELSGSLNQTQSELREALETTTRAKTAVEEQLPLWMSQGFTSTTRTTRSTRRSSRPATSLSSTVNASTGGSEMSTTLGSSTGGNASNYSTGKLSNLSASVGSTSLSGTSASTNGLKTSSSALRTQNKNSAATADVSAGSSSTPTSGIAVTSLNNSSALAQSNSNVSSLQLPRPAWQAATAADDSSLLGTDAARPNEEQGMEQAGTEASHRFTSSAGSGATEQATQGAQITGTAATVRAAEGGNHPGVEPASTLEAAAVAGALGRGCSVEVVQTSDQAAEQSRQQEHESLQPAAEMENTPPAALTAAASVLTTGTSTASNIEPTGLGGTAEGTAVQLEQQEDVSLELLQAKLQKMSHELSDTSCSDDDEEEEENEFILPDPEVMQEAVCGMVNARLAQAAAEEALRCAMDKIQALELRLSGLTSAPFRPIPKFSATARPNMAGSLAETSQLPGSIELLAAVNSSLSRSGSGNRAPAHKLQSVKSPLQMLLQVTDMHLGAPGEGQPGSLQATSRDMHCDGRANTLHTLLTTAGDWLARKPQRQA